MKQSDSIIEIAKALNQVQGKLGAVAHDAENPYFQSSYASLGAIWAYARPLLEESGLSVSQLPGRTNRTELGATMELTTILLHTSGEYLSETMTIPLAKIDPQGMGSALSYARRYGLAAVLGITTGEDDDGQAASRNNHPGTTSKPIAVLGPTATKIAAESEPAPNGQPRFKDNIPDARAWLEAEIKDNLVVLRRVADALCMTGLYNDNKHVANVLNGEEFAEQRKAGLDTDLRRKIYGSWALKTFDKCIDRKKADEVAA